MNYENYIVEQSDKFENDLFELLRIPSISADPQHRPDVRRAATWVADQFNRIQLKAELLETAGNPIVYAETAAVPGAPIVLVYGHYDVQPPDPLDLWISPPFEPTIRDGNVYARGATDDKGQLLTHIKSAQAWLETAGQIPVQIKYLVEGEEEVGSDNLTPFIQANRERLACDCVVISDSSQFGPDRPAITYALRGLAYFELQLTGPRQDLHSGTFGGAVANPANVLCQLLASLVNERGRVLVPGFYDDVLPLTAEEQRQMAALPFNDADFMRQIGVEGLLGEVGFTTLERRSARPSYDISGLTSGYQGEGGKTVLPARASAKFSFRLVPNQDPRKVASTVEAFLRSRCPQGIKLELLVHLGSQGVVVPLDSPYIAAAKRAIEHAFGAPPLFMREGGSIPVVGTFHDVLGVDTLLLGWGLDDDGAHSPNEKFALADYHRGIQASARLWEELASVPPRKK